jgi:hypothetical protein
MKSIGFKMICRFLIVALMALPFQSVQAGMIAAEKAVAATASGERAAVLAMINRDEVRAQLAERGIDPKSAGDRVMAMSDDEVRSLAGQLDAVPAGAKNNGWGWAVVIIIAVIVWYNWK